MDTYEQHQAAKRRIEDAKAGKDFAAKEEVVTEEPASNDEVMSTHTWASAAEGDTKSEPKAEPPATKKAKK